MLFAKNSTAKTTVRRVRFRSTTCVPPWDAGVNPRPPMPASRPECMRMSAVIPITISTWVTARIWSTRPEYPALRAGGLLPLCDLDDRLDELGRDPVLRHIARRARFACAVDVGARVRAGQHEDGRVAADGTDLSRCLDPVEH